MGSYLALGNSMGIFASPESVHEPLMKALTVGITEPDSIQWTSFLPPKTVTATECLRKAKDQVHGSTIPISSYS